MIPLALECHYLQSGDNAISLEAISSDPVSYWGVVECWISAPIVIKSRQMVDAHHSLCSEVHTFYRKMEFCTMYMGVNDVQAMHMAVKL